MDYITDNNFKGLNLFTKLAGENRPACFDGTLPSKEDIDKLPNSLFADPITREYPIDTPQHTFLSALYAYTDGAVKTASEVSEDTKKAIKLASEMHGIGEEVEKMAHLVGQFLVKTAAEQRPANTVKFAYISGDTGYFPINNILEIDQASRDVENKCKDIPLPIIKVACENILNAYNELPLEEQKAINLSQTVKDYGNLYVKDCMKVAAACKQRYDLSKNDFYKELGEVALTEGKDNTVLLEKMASTMYELDVQTGLDKEYGNMLVDPFIAGNTDVTIKQAAEYAADYVQMFEQLIPFKVFMKEPVKEAIKVACSKQASEALLNEINAEQPDTIKFEQVINGLSENDQIMLYKVAYQLG